jgi:predicted TPR repeat methyltransferase
LDRSARDHLEQVYAARDVGELTQSYADWAEQYDRDVMTMGYQTPAIVAGLMGRHVPPAAGPVLDCGAGSGLVGLLLAGLGYRELAAMDMSEAMLDVARARGCYDDVRTGVLGERLDYPDHRFAAIVAAGAFTAGHAPASAFDEIARILRPGGVSIVSERVDGDANADYRARRDALEADGARRFVERTELLTIFPLEPAEAGLRHRAFVYEGG